MKYFVTRRFLVSANNPTEANRKLWGNERKYWYSTQIEACDEVKKQSRTLLTELSRQLSYLFFGTKRKV